MSITIRQTSQVIPQLSDLIAIYQDVNSDTRNTSLSRLLTLFEDNISSGKPDTQYEAPNATGFELTVDSTDGTDIHMLIVPAGAYADGEVNLPTLNLIDKQTVLVTCTQAVTAFVVDGGGKTVNGAPTALTANAFFTMKYDVTFDAWYRVG